MKGSSYTEYYRNYYQQNKKKIVQDNLERRKLLIRLHLCRECGKKDAYTMNGHTRCADCVEKDTIRRREQRGYRPLWERETKQKPEVNYPRGDNGICWQCNKLPVMDGRRLCRTCYEMKVEVLRRNNFNRGKGRSSWKHMKV